VDHFTGRHYPIHPLVVLVVGQRINHKLVVGHAYTHGGGSGQKPVIVPAAKSQSPAVSIEGDAGRQHQVKRSRVYYWQVGCGFEHPKAMGHQTGRVVDVQHHPIIINYAGDDPVRLRQRVKEWSQVNLVAKGQVGEDRD